MNPKCTLEVLEELFSFIIMKEGELPILSEDISLTADEL